MSDDPTRIDIALDPLRRRMYGVARHGHTPFDVPYISHIDGNLYVGGCTNGLRLPTAIDHVVSLYPWEEYELSRQVKSWLQVVMYDAEEQGMEQVESIAQWVKGCLKDGPTLVHCQAGLNRSNLIAASALVLLGWRPENAIAKLREKRSPAVLCNPAFEAHLLGQAA